MQDVTNLFSSVLEGLPSKFEVDEIHFRSNKNWGFRLAVSNPFIDEATVRGLLYEES